jgi:MAF protein
LNFVLLNIRFRISALIPVYLDRVSFTEKRKIILASASPRRKELLEKIGLKFSIAPSNYPENFVHDKDPVEIVKTLSVRKAEEVARQYPDSIIIAADTIGVLRGKIIGKPHTPDEARQMLRSMSGKSHRVITGFTILMQPKEAGYPLCRNESLFKKNKPARNRELCKIRRPLTKPSLRYTGLGSVIVKR